jgi:hypothetical protein
MITSIWPWLTLVLLGAWHGLNPGMGWLFCVALGLQQKTRKALFGALAPIALGHALAIAMVVCVVYLIGTVLPFRWLQIGSAAALLGVALWKLYRLRHPKWVGMCVNFWDLTLWSWLMASAHGAGLMVLPVLLGAKSVFCGTTPSATSAILSLHPVLVLGAVGVHTIAHLVAAAAVAWIVYDFVGLTILRRSWINLDLIWSVSLLGAALFLFIAPTG